MEVDGIYGAGDSSSSSKLPILQESAELPSFASFPLKLALQLFLEDLGVDSTSSYGLDYVSSDILQVLKRAAYLDIDPPSTSHVLVALSLAAAEPGLIQSIYCRFKPIVADLLARWIADLPAAAQEWEQKAFILSELAECAEELWGVIYDFIVKSPFLENGLLAFCAAGDGVLSIPAQRLQLLLLAQYRLVSADPSLPKRNRWRSAPLLRLIRSHQDAGVRLLAISCYGQQMSLSELGRMKLEEQYLGSQQVDAKVLQGWVIEKRLEGGSGMRLKEIDGWVLNIAELQRRDELKITEIPGRTSLPDYSSLELVEDSLCAAVTVVGTTVIYKPPGDASSTNSSEFLHVSTPSNVVAVDHLSYCLQRRLPILLSSLTSAGKTHIIHYMASRIYPLEPTTNRVLTIAAADTSLDAKSLLGSYVSSPSQPGTFTWTEGALTKAVRSGRWVVVEDLDRASQEVLSLFSTLADGMGPAKMAGSRVKLNIPGRKSVEAGLGFALIATRTVNSVNEAAKAAFLGHNYFANVYLPAPNGQEIIQMLNARFPSLSQSAAGRLIDIYLNLSSQMSKLHGRSKGRSYGLRDLEKWCARVERILPEATNANSHTSGFVNPVVQDEVFMEALDIFTAAFDSASSSALRQRQEDIAALIAASLDIGDERRDFLLRKRIPQLEIIGDSRARASKEIRIGRASLTGLPKDPTRLKEIGRPYALTRPSLVLLERLAAGIAMSEPVLLVGETGTGKTTAVQYFADVLNRPLTVLNMSTQTETGDLLGGFKPIDAALPGRELHGRWLSLFRRTFSKNRNEKYETGVRKAINSGNWRRVADMWIGAADLARDRLQKAASKADMELNEDASGSHSPRKRRKVDHNTVSSPNATLEAAWELFRKDVATFLSLHIQANSKLVFSFVEGPLIKALREGDWILLDEVNLASHETLQSLTAMLENATSSITLTERGDLEPVRRHPDFRLFACMNPATDVGKKDLLPGLRARFTEVFVPPPDDDKDALLAIVKQYLGNAAGGDRAAILDVAEFYMSIKAMSRGKELVDGSNFAPHYSMRTLARALTFAVEVSPIFGLRRALWEGCLMTFTMSLDAESSKKAKAVISRHLLGSLRNPSAVINQPPNLPSSSVDDYVRFGHFWLRRGPLAIPSSDSYVITPSVESKLSDLARAVLTRKFPILIQGPTSSGKTSAIEFLARSTGHQFVRLNNHEHTDIQEYLGTYTSDAQTGKLVYNEGILVRAVKEGHWIVLDELNLAPSDVLEALNRLLDDNRELTIPETQEIIRPHPDFMLFATQNPPGLYGGRKVLSRAFRNRFLEVHFDDVPQAELQTILCQRCAIPPSYAQRIVQVFAELRHRRQAARVFESKQSYATLRDLFRWADRKAESYQQLAENGYMLLGARARRSDDAAVVKEVIELVMKVKINDRILYTITTEPASAYGRLGLPLPFHADSRVVWTAAMQRLFSLVATASVYKEPVLLVGETGSGKTSVCQALARVFERTLVAVNCYQTMETADLLGSQRPVRNRSESLNEVVAELQSLAITVGVTLSDPESSSSTQSWAEMAIRELRVVGGSDIESQLSQAASRLQLAGAMFEWRDGPLVAAMQDGSIILLDEISLADDSVLERLNSVLEPGRTLTLAEKGGSDLDSLAIVAAPEFQVVATMNPGGDYGKKELSPALRNRFSEIWVAPLSDREDLVQILATSGCKGSLASCAGLALDFVDWFRMRVQDDGKSGIGLRDLLAWSAFMVRASSELAMDIASAFVQGAQLVIIDGLETIPGVAGLSRTAIDTLRMESLAEAQRLAATLPGDCRMFQDTSIHDTPHIFGVGPFTVEKPADSKVNQAVDFSLQAPTTLANAIRVLRACQLPKAVLLEGSPGVGKTSLVQALATASGRELCRINLSEQTDLIDLFGSDLPVVGGRPGEFAWRDAAFLTALRHGDWVLLDEMNLASQAILEGLNAVLDHRGTVYIPELGRSFEKHPDFRVFAAQNPVQQGGGRKGLPKSFLNRFTKVYVMEHTNEDLLTICSHRYPEVPAQVLSSAIFFNARVSAATTVDRTIGRIGSPWEFNLRDIMRWLQVDSVRNGLEKDNLLGEFGRLCYVDRFRTLQDQKAIAGLLTAALDTTLDIESRPWLEISSSRLQIGHSLASRSTSRSSSAGRLSFIRQHLPVQESLLKAVEMRWLVILAGHAGSGKRSLIRLTADILGVRLAECNMHSAIDTMEMLGSFEQTDSFRALHSCVADLRRILWRCISLRELDLNNLDEAEEISRRLDTEPTIERAQAALAWLRPVAGEGERSLDTIGDRLRDLAMTGLTSTSSFDWVDGPLVRALRSGDWFVINDANLCAPSVLDRLNSLCEFNGSLVLTEKGSESGSPETIHPHPNFRLFMTFDPKHGELSRAMRNRGLEIFVSSVGSEDASRMRQLPQLTGSQLKPQDDPFENCVVAMVDSRVARILQHLPHLRDNVTPLSNAQLARAFAAQPASSSPLTAVRALSHLSALSEGHRSMLPELTALIGYSKPLPIAVGICSVHAEDLPVDITVNGQFSSSPPSRLISQALSLYAENALLAFSASQSSQGWIQAGPTKGSMAPAITTQIASFTQAIHEFISREIGIALNVVDTAVFQTFLRTVADVLVLLNMVGLTSQEQSVNWSSLSLAIKGIRGALGNRLDLLSASALHTFSTLGNATSLITGKAQRTVWQWLLEDDAWTSSLDTHNLLTLVQLRGDDTLLAAVMQAMVTLPSSELSKSQVVEITSALTTLPIQNGEGSQIDKVLLASAHLRALKLAFAPGNEARELLQVLTKMYRRDATLALESLIPLWKIAGGLGGGGQSSIEAWMSLAFSISQSPMPTILQPVALVSAVKASEPVKLKDLAQQAQDVQNTSAILRSQLHQPLTSRLSEMLSVAVTSLTSICEAFGCLIPNDSTFPDSDIASDQHKSRLALIAKTVEATSPSHLATAWSQHISPVFNVIATYDGLTSQHIGQLWLAISWTLLDLYVPNIPIDPAVEQNMQRQACDHRVQRLREELHVWRQATKAISGNDSTPAIIAIEQDLENIELEVQQLPPAPRARAVENSVINTFFAETYQFLHDVFSKERLSDLMSVLDGPGSHGQGIAREEALQQASSAFLTRLQSRYSDIRDLARPVALAVRHGQIGLSLFSQSARLGAESDRDEVQHLANALVAFPTVKSSRLLQGRHLQGHPGLGSTPSLLIALSAHGYAASIGERIHNQTAAVSEIYERLSLLAERDDQRKAAETQEAESLYRQRKTEEEVLSDLELDAKEMAELFPTYEDPDTEVPSAARPASDSKTLITEEDLRAAYQIHMLLYGRVADASSDSDFAQRRDGQVAKLLKESVQSLDERLDEVSLPYQVQRLARGSLAFSDRSSDDRNFYTSANKGEANRALNLLSSLADRLRAIQDEWPDQMVLHHILDRCSSIMQMSAESPVARFLPAMEQLLEHTEDWENFANKDNSISKHRRDIIDLIVSWRRQELQYWSVLLRQHIEAFELELAPWWVKLYRLLVSGPMSLVQSANTGPDAPSLNKHLEEATKLLIEFMQGSQLGHFIPRLRLLEAFEKYVHMLNRWESNDSLSDLWKAVTLIIMNVRRQFVQFEPLISEHFQQGRQALEKSIQDYIKLASWKDINVQALRASAKKTHGQLFKSVRKLRELLKEPVSPLLARPLPPVSTEEALDVVASAVEVASIGVDLAPAINTRQQLGPVAKPLASLEPTVARFTTVLGSVEPDIVAELHLTLEDLSSDIVSTVKQLGDETPSKLTEENAKFLRNLELRKRKALSELLKALRSLGFSAKVPATQLLKQQTLLFLHQLADLPRKAGSRSLVERVDEYHNRLHSILPNMRSGLASHSDDIATPDLARAHGFAESVFTAALTSREKLAEALQFSADQSAMIARAKAIAREGLGCYGIGMSTRLEKLDNTLPALLASVSDVISFCEYLTQLYPDLDIKINDAVTVLKDLQGEGRSFFAGVRDIVSGVNQSFPALTIAESDVLVKTEMYMDRTLAALGQLSSDFPLVRHPLEAVLSMTPQAPVRSQERSTTVEEVWASNDEALSALLVLAQKVSDLMKPDLGAKGSVTVNEAHLRSRRWQQTLGAADVRAKILKFTHAVVCLEEGQRHVVSAAITRLAAFMPAYDSLWDFVVSQQAAVTKSHYKLCYILAQLFITIAQKGFCKPSDADDKSGQEAGGPEQEGTGMGAGSGSENVSKEIEDESQVEGLRGEEEEEEKDEGGERADNDAIEMEDDFGGALEDAKSEAGDEGSEGEDQDEKDELDEHLGDVEDEGVDEKFWDDEKETGEKRDDKMDQKGQDDGKQSEMAAKEEESASNQNDRKEKDQPEPEGQMEEGDDGADEDQQSDTMSQTADDRQDGQQLDTTIPEQDILDLPDNLELEEDQGDVPDDDCDEEMEDAEAQEGSPERNIDEDPNGPAEDDQDNEAEAQAMEIDGPGTGDEPEEEADMAHQMDVSAGADDTQGQADGVETGAEQKAERDAEMDDDVAEAPEDQEEGRGGKAQGQSESAANQAPEEEGSRGNDTSGNAPAGQDNSRSLGDQLQDIRRLIEEIRQRSETDAENERAAPELAPEQEQGQFEHLREDEDADTQALGNADAEQHKSLTGASFIDAKEQAQNDQDVAMDDNELVPAKQDEDVDTSLNFEKDINEDAQGQSSGSAGMTTTNEVVIQLDSLEMDDELTGDNLMENGLPASEEEHAADDHDLEVQMTSQSHGDRTEADGEKLWQRYSTLTHDLSHTLCEQLRLILEPTLATRLQGDYRTGKRLNMRKIIPYIASEYTKDKIWLRRTKPSRREYQVLLSLDDSRSMADSHSVHLAYQTIALVSQALNKLEVGQLSVARFGEGVEIIHPFGDTGFSHADGTKVMQSFKFDQHKTDVAELVDRSLSVLGEARQSRSGSSAPDLWQLEIIISDGICQDHPRLRKLLRRALDERVMIVFLVLDSLNRTPPSAAPGAPPSGRTSVLTMQTVAYKDVAGEMQIEMNRYLDTFPFEYYVVLQDVEALPDTLSEILRQWMMRVSLSEE